MSLTSQQIRETFLNFFAKKGHTIVASAPMVIKNDPTLMFTNAGMNPFKEYFLGNSHPKHKRIADTQKCLRVSGKHNDLEEVGRDTYHHTMFEMLGNWSFGDYFKKDAIAWAWELLTEVYHIPKDMLYVTIFEGDEKEGLEKDHQAYQYWCQHIPAERILNGNKKDNFWEMGDQGPCGPCTEIHVDLRSDEEKQKTPGHLLVNKDNPLVVEIWNLVFMQFNRKADGTLEKLAAQHVDTGMGFERLCMVLQNKTSNYDTDVFQPIIKNIEAISQKQYGVNTESDIAIRVVADHLRAVSFAIADGQLPSNTGAGYVIRRILRRAIRYGFTFLGMKKPFIYKLVNTLAEQMGGTFHELVKQQTLIENVIREEEHSFLKTLEQGLILLEGMINATEDKILSGSKAFVLYDTYGFPIDLTALIVQEKGISLDYKGFEKELQQQKERSRTAAQVKTDDWTTLVNQSTEQFVGYDTLECETRITRYRKIETPKDGVLYQLTLSLTPFYPEGGGQVGEKGVLIDSEGNTTPIIDTKKENNLIIHIVKTLPTNLNDTFKAVVSSEYRKASANNHSATHLLHQALREVLGTHVEQRGSRVTPEGLRFDFSHFQKVTPEELLQIEQFVNDKIQKQIPLEEYRNLPYDKAIEKGAMALFGEKYGDTVRMIQFGDSKELCGGIHTQNTGHIWHFKIVGESAVAAGIRRIEAITANAVKSYFYNQEKTLQQIKTQLKTNQDVVKSIEQLQKENQQLQQQVEDLQKQQVAQLKSELKKNIQHINGFSFISAKLELGISEMKDLAFQLEQECKPLFIILGSEVQGKALLLCYISKELTKKTNLDAGKIIRQISKHINGGGGGQPFLATAGGTLTSGIENALNQAYSIASKSE